jgi:hypothetical protein
MIKNKDRIGGIACWAILLLSGLSCEKVKTGYLSPALYYVQNPLVAARGANTVSGSLQVNGSTTPIHVDLMKVVDSNGNRVDSLLAVKGSFPGFSDAVSAGDSTLDLLNKKIVPITAPAVSVSPEGGRIQVSPASKAVPMGTYTIDIKVSNPSGSVSLPNACKIVIAAAIPPDTIYSGSYAGTLDNGGNYAAGLANPSISVQFIPASVNKIVYKWIDKNGKVYNARANGIDVRKGRWNFRNFDPYYPQVLTDTSVEYQYPTVPNEFPVFPNTGADGNIPRGNFGCFFKLPNGITGNSYGIFTFTDIAFFSQGLYIVTINLSDISFN